MTQIALIICDHCDSRDRTDDGSTPRNDIKQVNISVRVDGSGEPFVAKDLCAACRENLQTQILNAITPIPRQA